MVSDTVVLTRGHFVPRGAHAASMMPKSGYRFSENIMLQQ
jgi:hypothetical protein